MTYDNIESLLASDGFEDGCGKAHFSGVKGVFIGKGVINKLPDLIKELNTKKAFLLADENTWKVAGSIVSCILESANIPFSKYVFKEKNLKPNEYSVGSAVMHFDKSCDIVVGIGSGVINDISKILAGISGCEYIIVGTAPSMDGFASSTSSMERDGLKLSLNFGAASYIIGDTDILLNAPDIMLASGVGDMIAKYVSLAEWKISHIVTGEYYCETIAEIIRKALDSVVLSAPLLMKRDPTAIEAVMRGMVISGIAMNYAGITRPASGTEHYFSHIWDMRGLEFGTPTALHGIQCGVGTLLTLKLYERLRKITPSREKALAHAADFNKSEWFDTLRTFVGKGADAMISAEENDQKYSANNHLRRLDKILSNWELILDEINKLPSFEEIEKLLVSIGAPTTVSELGHDESEIKLTFQATRDVRFKYISSHLLWDIGEEY